MRIISFNVNGINSALRDGFLEFLQKSDADIICLQEVKSHWDRMEDALKSVDDYEVFSCQAEKRGYSGLLVYTKKEPISVVKGLGDKEIDKEGRVLTLEYDGFYLVNAYFPHTGRELFRMDFKLRFNDKFLKHCEKLKKNKPLVVAGDFNVAHEEIDLANPKQNQKNAGFTKEERVWFDRFLAKGYIDTFREFEKEGGFYTWWSYRATVRERNIGWRIDYFVVSKDLKSKLKDSYTMPKVRGSDHCPIGMEIDL